MRFLDRCNRCFCDVAVLLLEILQYIFFSCCSIYNPNLHYTVFLICFCNVAVEVFVALLGLGHDEKTGVSENGGQGCGGKRRKGWVPFLFHRRRDGVPCRTDVRTHSRAGRGVGALESPFNKRNTCIVCCKTTSCESMLVVRKLGCGLWVRYLAVPSSCISRSAVPCTMLMMLTQIILRSTVPC
jgi:hypothetical protein